VVVVVVVVVWVGVGGVVWCAVPVSVTVVVGVVTGERGWGGRCDL